MTNVIKFPGGEETPDDLLASLTGRMVQIVVVGIDRNGYFIADGAGFSSYAELIGTLALGQASFLQVPFE
jgi:hypothetical protein